MSTKIYNGFKFDEGMDLFHVHKVIMDFRSVAKEIAYNEVCAWKASRCAQLFDDHTMRRIQNEDVTKSIKQWGIHYTTFRELMDRQREIEKSGLRDPEIDFSFEIAILPLKRYKILGIYYCENKTLVEAWMDQNFISEYHCQNSTDRPKDLSAKEWNKRNRDWDSVLTGAGVPAQNGFVAKITELHYPITQIADILKSIPNLKQRSERVGRELILHERVDFNDKESFWRECDWIRTKEGKKAVKDRAAKIKKQLKRRISKNDLVEKL